MPDNFDEKFPQILAKFDVLYSPKILIEKNKEKNKKYIAAIKFAQGVQIAALVTFAELGIPPGSGVPGSFANLVTRHRSSLDPAMIEMILFCKLNFSLIPSTIPVVATAAIDAKVPMRYRDPDLNQQLLDDVPADIDSDLEEENNFEDDD